MLHLVSAQAFGRNAHGKYKEPQAGRKPFLRQAGSGYEMKTKYDDDLNYDKQSNLPVVLHNYITRPVSRPANSANSRKNTHSPSQKTPINLIIRDFLLNAGGSPSASSILFPPAEVLSQDVCGAQNRAE